MKTTNYTPGHWSCRKSETSRPESVRVDIVTDAGEFSPCFIAGDALPADAALICAAPDLLHALDLLLNKLNAHGIKNNHLVEAIEKAECAISKARGNK